MYLIELLKENNNKIISQSKCLFASKKSNNIKLPKSFLLSIERCLISFVFPILQINLSYLFGWCNNIIYCKCKKII